MKTKFKIDFRNQRIIVDDVKYLIVNEESYKNILKNAIRWCIESDEHLDLVVTFPFFNKRLVPESFLKNVMNYNLKYLNKKLSNKNPC